MFTGIIEETGIVEKRSGSQVVFRTRQAFLRRVKRGVSVAVDGACLTVVGKTLHGFLADIMSETTRRTRLQRIPRGARVNLELPATSTTLLSGHIVQGHVDGVATLAKITQAGNSRVLTFSIPRALSKYIVEKGSIAVNGVSLTVVGTGKSHFTVGIIPHTWENTSFRFMIVGAKANIEVDVLAKYVEKLL